MQIVIITTGTLAARVLKDALVVGYQNINALWRNGRPPTDHGSVVP
jgi:hypothetical protein